MTITPEDRFQEWFTKLQMLHGIGERIGRKDVADAASEMIELSIARWGEQIVND